MTIQTGSKVIVADYNDIVIKTRRILEYYGQQTRYDSLITKSAGDVITHVEWNNLIEQVAAVYRHQTPSVTSAIPAEQVFGISAKLKPGEVISATNPSAHVTNILKQLKTKSDAFWPNKDQHNPSDLTTVNKTYATSSSAWSRNLGAVLGIDLGASNGSMALWGNTGGELLLNFQPYSSSQSAQDDSWLNIMIHNDYIKLRPTSSANSNLATNIGLNNIYTSHRVPQPALTIVHRTASGAYSANTATMTGAYNTNSHMFNFALHLRDNHVNRFYDRVSLHIKFNMRLTFMTGVVSGFDSTLHFGAIPSITPPALISKVITGFGA